MKQYLDLVQGWAVNSLGHSPPVIAEALARQAQRLINPSPAFHNRPMLDLAERLKRRESFSNLIVRVHINGQLRWWELSGTPKFDDKGGFDGFRAAVMELRAVLNIPANLSALGVVNPDLDTLTDMALEDPSCGGNPIAMTRANTRARFEACM